MTPTLIIIAVQSILHYILEFAPYPELFVYPFLTSKGFLPYQQILDQHFPGLLFFPINFYSLGFGDPLSFKILSIVIVTVIALWLYKLTKSWIPVILYTFLQPTLEGTQLWLDSFLPLFLLPAYYFFQKKRWIALGLCLGLGVIFKQTLIPLVGVVGLLVLSRANIWSTLKYSLACILPSGIMLSYFAAKNILSDFIYWAIHFNLTGFASEGRLSPTPNEAIRLLVFLSVILLAYLRIPKSRILIIWLVFSVLGGIARFGYIHLQPAIPFFIIVITWVIKRYKVMGLALLCCIGLLSFRFYSTQTNLLGYKFFGIHETQVIQYITTHTTDGEKIFLLGVNPHLYEQADRLPPGKLFVFQFPWFLKLAGERQLNALKAEPPALMVFDPDSNIDGQYLKNYASYLVNYMQSSYQLTTKIGPYEIYARRI